MEHELYHYGRKGMKWGQNIFGKKRSGTSVSSSRKTKGKTATVKAKKKRKKISEMTDAELKQHIERLNLEKSYRDAIKDKRKSSLGKRFIDKTLEASVDKIAENATADVIAQVAKVVTTRVANQLLKEEAVFTNNKKKA